MSRYHFNGMCAHHDANMFQLFTIIPSTSRVRFVKRVIYIHDGTTIEL